MNTLLTFSFKSPTGKVSTGSFSKIKSLIESNNSYPVQVFIESTVVDSHPKKFEIVNEENDVDSNVIENFLKIILEESLNMLSRGQYDLACTNIWTGDSRSTLEAVFSIDDGEDRFTLNTSKVEWPLLLDPISFYVFCLFRNITGYETRLIKPEI